MALRDFFSDYKMRAQQNTRYIEADVEEAIRTHTIDTLISMLTSADVQSTITPDEGRNVPWHYNNIRGVQTVKQTWAALDGVKELLAIKTDGPLGEMVRDIKERAVAFLEEVIEVGGYFAAVEQGFFVDSAKYPERNGDGIARDGESGVGANTIVPRDPDYMAPVCAHFGDNHLPAGLDKPCDPVGGCTLCDPEKIVYIDELDPEDSVDRRLEQTLPYRKGGMIRPEAEWAGDGTVLLQLMVPESEEFAHEAALEIARRMGLAEPEVINLMVLHPAEGCFVEVKGKVDFDIEKTTLKIPPKDELLPEEELRAAVKQVGLKVVTATVGEDEHSVGLREILDIKHGGIEKYGVKHLYLGTSVPLEQADRRGHRDRRARDPHVDDHQPQRHTPHPDDAAGGALPGEGHPRQGHADRRRHAGDTRDGRRDRPGRHLRPRHQGHPGGGRDGQAPPGARRDLSVDESRS